VVGVRDRQAASREIVMSEVLSAFARQVRAEAEELAASFPDPAAALTAVHSMLRRAENNPSAFMARKHAAGPAEARATLSELAGRAYARRGPAA
jgi:hypothetical protein